MKNNFNDWFALIGRVLVALIFLFGAALKIKGYAQTARLMSAHHVSGHLLPLVIALELGGGLALVFGFLTRVIAACLAVYSVAAIAIFLLPPANQLMWILVLAELGMVGGLVSYLRSGPGRFSLDHALFKRNRM